MQTMVPLYGFGGGSGGTGATLTVTAPAGATVTVSKDGKSKTKVADSSGLAVFKGLSSGDWLLSITDGTQTAQKTVTITADYTTAITFFSATIHITYPAGSKCTATDGVTTLTAPDTSGVWDCVVPNAGMWTIKYNGVVWGSVDITTNGQSESIYAGYLYYKGNEFTDVTGGWTSMGKKMNSSSSKGAIAPTITRGTDSIKAAGALGKAGIFYCTNKIDLTGVTKIDVKGTIYKSNAAKLYLALCIWSSFGTYYADNVVASLTNDAAGTYTELSLSVNLTGSYYVGFGIADGSYIEMTEFKLS